MGERIKIDPRGFKGPDAGKSGEVASDQTVKAAEARYADATRKADAAKKAADLAITNATSADQIAKTKADAQKALLELQKIAIELEALKAGGVPLTESQGKAGSFYSRMLSAEQSMEKLNQDPDSLIGKTAYEIAPGLTAMASTSKRTTNRDYIKNFLMASLRKESGAVIAPFELTNQYQIYFPSANASQEEIAAKKQQRLLAIANMRGEAGPAGPRVDKELLAQGFVPYGMEKPKEEQPAGAANAAVAEDRVAGADAKTTTVEVPKELQAAVIDYVNSKGTNIDAQEFKNFYNEAAAKYGHPGRIDDAEAKRNADAIREGARYGGIASEERPLSAVERGVNAALLSDPGAFATGVFNATTMGIPAALSENVGRSTEGVRDENGLAYGIGELGGNLAMTTGGGGLLKLAGLSPARAELLSDLGYSAITGFTGAPEGDRLSGAATNTLFAGMGAAAPSVVKRTLKTNPDDDIKILREAGVRLTPAQTIGGNVDRVEEAASRMLLGGGDVAIASRKRAFNDFNTAYLNQAGKYIGVELPSNLKPQERMKAMRKAFDERYDDIRNQMTVAPDQELLDDISVLQTQINDGISFSDTQAARLQKLLDDQLKRRTANPIDGQEYKSLQSDLRKYKKKFTSNPNDVGMADAVDNMLAVLDNAARRRSPPEAVEMLNQTDRGFALFAQAQEAAGKAGSKPGEFTPAQLLARIKAADPRVRSGSFIEGDMEGQRLAEAAQNVLGNVLPSSGTSERLAAGTLVTGGSSYLTPWTALPNAMIGIANAPGVRDVLPAVFAGRRPAGVELVGELMDKYKVPLRYLGAQAGRMLSPSDQTPEDYTMTNIENPIKVTAQSGYPSGLAAAEAAAAVPVEGPVLMDGRPTEVRDGRRYFVGTNELAEADPLADRSDPALGMYRGGTVQAFKNGGDKGTPKKAAGYDYGNAARTFGQGLTFGTADEAEGFVRSLLSGRPYKTERDEIRRLQERYALANPNTALALEGAGMIGGSMLVPSLGAARAVASAPRLTRIGAAFGDDLAQGVAYTAGKAKERKDIAGDIRKDALGNAAAFVAATGVEHGGGAAGRRVAGKVASTKPGYQAAMTLKRLMSKY